jgi:hypothetical protein
MTAELESIFNNKRAAEAMAERKRQAAYDTGLQKNRELLASPEKLDNFVADNTKDIFPFVKSPKKDKELFNTDVLEKGLKDHPLQGSVKAIKGKFSQALADPRYAGVDHASILDAVKKDHLAMPGEDGKSLLTKSHEYKYDKDNGLFRFFSDKGDENVTAMPGYDAFKAQKKIEEPYDTSLAESVAWNIGGTLAITAATALTGGTAPTALALGMRLTKAAALAYPEFKLFDKLGNMAAKNRQNPNDPSLGELTTELIAGGVGIAGLHKGIGIGTGKALATAMKYEKTAASAAAIASYTGKAPEALKAYSLAKDAKDAVALAERETIAAEAALKTKQTTDFKTKLDETPISAEATHTKSLIERRQTHAGAVSPIDAHLMGLSPDEFKVMEAKPSVLYSALSEEGVAEATAAIEAGENANKKILEIFNREAALKKQELLLKGKTPTDIVGAVEKDYGLETHKTLLGEPTLVVKAAKQSKKAKKAEDVSRLHDILINGSKVVAGAVGLGGALAAGDSDASTIDAAIKASGKVFNTIGEHAVKLDSFPAKVTVQGDSLWNQFKKFGMSKAEFTDLGLDGLKPGTTVTKSELEKLVAERSYRPEVKEFGGQMPGRWQYKLKDGRSITADEAGERFYINRDDGQRLSMHGSLATALDATGAGQDEFVAAMKSNFQHPKAATPLQYEGYHPIQDKTGLIPGSQRERIVQIKGGNTDVYSSATQLKAKDYFAIEDSTWNTLDEMTKVSYADEMLGSVRGREFPAKHPNYQGKVTNPTGRHEYVLKRDPEGKLVYEAGEFQAEHVEAEVDEVTGKVIDKFGVPDHFANDKAIAIAVKDAIANAKSLGADYITWPLGSEVNDLYSNVLKGIADEARYNPVTKELTVLKNNKAVKGYPKIVEPQNIDKYTAPGMGKKLLESPINAEGKTTHTVNPDYGSARIFDNTDEAMQYSEQLARERAFESIGAEELTRRFKTFDSELFAAFEEQMRNNGSVYARDTRNTAALHDGLKRVVVSANESLYEMPTRMGNTFIKTATKLDLTPEELLERVRNHITLKTEHFPEIKTVKQHAGTHQVQGVTMDSQWAPALYGNKKGAAVFPEFKELRSGELRTQDNAFAIRPNGNNWDVLVTAGQSKATEGIPIKSFEGDQGYHQAKEFVKNSYGQGVEYDFGAKLPSMMKKYGKGTPELINGRPGMRLTPETPSNFSLYSHPAAVLGVSLTAGATALQANGASDGEVLAQNTQDIVAEKSVLSKIADFFLPGDAYAGPMQATGAVVSKVIGEEIKNAAAHSPRTVTSLIEDIFGKGYIGLPVAEGQVTMNAPMKQVLTAPANGRSVAAANAAVKTYSTFMDGLVNAVNSPNFFANIYGQVEHRITNQMASMQSAIAHDTESGIKVLSNILTPALKDERAGNEIAKFMKPIQDRYNEVALPLRSIEVETSKAQSVINNLEATLGSGSNDAEIMARIAEEKNKLKGLSEEYATYNSQYPAVEKEYAEAKHTLLTKYRTSRISFAVEEPTLMADPRYSALYSPEEKAAVQQITDMLGFYKGRAQDAGMNVISGSYMRHSMDKTKLNEAFQARLAKMGINVDGKNIALSSFLERSKYSKQMIPDVQRNMLEYIPDAERRINVATLWDKKSDNGWYAFSQNDLIKSNKVWNTYFDNLKKAYNPMENTLMNDLVNKYSSIETLRLLFLAPSAAFKHLFKNEGTWATLGFFNSMKHMPESVEVASRNAVNESFYRLGLNSKITDRSQKDLFVRAITKQRHMLNPLDGMEKDPGVVSKVDEWLQKFNNVGGVGIQAVEAFDRTHTVLAALDMAAKKGMTAEQAMASIYDTILKNNFLGGGLNPAWMRNPKVRALMLFQGTPFKIMERRLMNAMALGSDVKSAWGVIKNQDLEKTLAELQGLGAYMIDSQNAFKANMIHDALTTHKDAYGNSVAAQFVREAVITGGVIAGGSAVGMDFHKHSFHIPFIKEGADPTLAVNPLTAAAYKTTFGPIAADDKTFFPARFLQNYLQTSGGVQPLMLHKFQRLSASDIPDIYKDSAFKYLFSIPATK